MPITSSHWGPVHDGEPGWLGVAGLRLGAIVASGLGPL